MHRSTSLSILLNAFGDPDYKPSIAGNFGQMHWHVVGFRINSQGVCAIRPHFKGMRDIGESPNLFDEVAMHDKRYVCPEA